MSKFIVLIGLMVPIFANEVNLDYVCKNVEKSAVEALMGIKLKYEKVGKMEFPNTSYCEYGNGVLPKLSIYYYKTKNSVNMYEKTKEIKGLNFPVQVVFVPSSGNVVQIVSQTKEGTLSFVFNDGIKEGDIRYTRALELIDTLNKKFP